MRIKIDEKEVEITIHKWTPFTTELLKLYSTHFNEITIHQKIEVSPVSKKKRNHYRYWSDKDDKFVGENRDKMSVEEMAVELNRTESAIRHRVNEIKAKNPGEKKSAPDNTDLFLKWLESWNKAEFETSDFISAYPQITKKNADEIMVYQVRQENLYQMGRDTFMVRKKE